MEIDGKIAREKPFKSAIEIQARFYSFFGLSNKPIQSYCKVLFYCKHSRRDASGYSNIIWTTNSCMIWIICETHASHFVTHTHTAHTQFFNTLFFQRFSGLFSYIFVDLHIRLALCQHVQFRERSQSTIVLLLICFHFPIKKLHK